MWYLLSCYLNLEFLLHFQIVRDKNVLEILFEKIGSWNEINCIKIIDLCKNV